MSELFWMTAIIDSHRMKEFEKFYEKNGVAVNLITLGKGTAGTEILSYFGLEETEKSVIMSVVTDETWKKIKSGLQKEMQIDVPGTGIAVIIPVSSMGGKKQLRFFIRAQHFERGEETVLKNTKYELLVVTANQGYTEQVMEAARKAGAGGGTMLHAKGTGMEGAQHFLGVTLAAEKEVIMIVVKKEQKNTIMKAIMEDAGLQSRAKAIVFSVPVTDTAGMRLTEEE